MRLPINYIIILLIIIIISSCYSDDYNDIIIHSASPSLSRLRDKANSSVSLNLKSIPELKLYSYNKFPSNVSAAVLSADSRQLHIGYEVSLQNSTENCNITRISRYYHYSSINYPFNILTFENDYNAIDAYSNLMKQWYPSRLRSYDNAIDLASSELLYICPKGAKLLGADFENNTIAVVYELDNKIYYRYSCDGATKRPILLNFDDYSITNYYNEVEVYRTIATNSQLDYWNNVVKVQISNSYVVVYNLPRGLIYIINKNNEVYIITVSAIMDILNIDNQWRIGATMFAATNDCLYFGLHPINTNYSRVLFVMISINSQMTLTNEVILGKSIVDMPSNVSMAVLADKIYLCSTQLPQLISFDIVR
jgi:hypothetical protein